MNEVLEQKLSTEYKYDFVTDYEADHAPKGINEDFIRFISAKKDKSEWILAYRL
ncbi:hypothetical protein RCH18_001087 [Flavobacterium sp. PL11]|uniref:hypothetical protein n=1 Tax=Flavobacterium sp. PL11 TaxID=3071717 RepID=UPI002DFA2423|nr:hypothetical protein [Flavobacterium sp. PL11]